MSPLSLRRMLAAVVFSWLAGGGASAALVHRWSFNQAAAPAPNSTVINDSVSALPMTVRGLGANLNGSRMVLPGTTNSSVANSVISAYLDLPNHLISTKASVTVEMWAAPLGVANSGWASLFEMGRMNIAGDGLGEPGEWTGNAAFGPGATEGSDMLALTSSRDLSLNLQRQVLMTNGQWQSTIDTGLATTPGQLYHYVVTVTDTVPGATVAWYRDGVLIGSNNVTFNLSDVEDVNIWFGRSNWGLSTGNTAYDEIRIYDHAFNPAEVVASRNAGPDAAFGPPVSAPDAATLHHLQKVRIPVLANDTGNFTPGSVSIDQAPQFGTAVPDASGRILYTHTTATPAADSFTYHVSGAGGNSAPAVVSLTFATSLRIPNSNLNVPNAPPPTAISLQPAFGALTFTQPICIATAPGDSQRLFVVQRTGTIRLVPNVTAQPATSSVFLNLGSLLSSRGEALGVTADQGLMSMAVHPQYASNGRFYLFYSVRIGMLEYFRVSRFNRSAGDPNVADPASELILIQQRDVNGYHLGTCLQFGPDGYLYISLGDGGGQNDSRQVSQRIDLDFFSAIARIDVDKLPGNPEPNIHASVPRDGGIARYSVPATNPYVTANPTVPFNGVNIPAANVRTEFFAVGFRNPWRFSFDSLTGALWCGDVGQVTYEEVNLVTNGGNYGWSFREGTVDGPQMWRAPAGFTSAPPLHQYGSGIPGNYNRSITGGVVYHGTRLGSLDGAYIFTDYITGDIWALRQPQGGGVTVDRIAGEAGIVSFALDPSNGDVLVADIAEGFIRRLVQGTDDSSYPQTLSATGLFADVLTLSPSPGLLPYTPNLSFWSDFAIKRRWFIVPGAADTMGWSRENAWTYPNGMIWVKHFDLETTRGDPLTAQRIETRVLVKSAAGSYGVSYRWNPAGTEATLAADGGENLPINIVENGLPRVQNYRIPSRAECASCHNPQAGHALSFNTRQLNRFDSIHGFAGNQIALLRDAGYFTNTPEPPNVLPRHLRPDETAFPVEARVRSYLAVNCANCHQAGGTAPQQTWDGRASLTLDQTLLVNGVAASNGGNPANRLILPGDPGHSIILNRMAVTNGFTRMPPLGSNELDQVSITLMTDWINQLPARQTYDQWRLAQFASAISPEGERAADPDGDGQSNEMEFLAGTMPNSGGSLFVPNLGAGGNDISLLFSLPANRSYQIDASTDLLNWNPWDVPGNNGVPHAGGPVSLSGPASSMRRFFKVRLIEN